MTNRSVGETDTDTTSCVVRVMQTVCTKSLELRLRSHLRTQARRDKKAFLSDQCKEIEENNRMGKTEIS